MNTDLKATLQSLIADIQREREAEREAERRKRAKANELATVICPFTQGERIILPRPYRCSGIPEGMVKGIQFDLDHGYSLMIEQKNSMRGFLDYASISGHLNPEIEDANGKTPVVMPDELAALLEPLRGRGGYYV